METTLLGYVDAVLVGMIIGALGVLAVWFWYERWGG